MPEQNRLSYLFQRYATNTCTRVELTELASLMATGDEVELHHLMDAHYARLQPAASADRIDWEEMFRQIIAQRPATAQRPVTTQRPFSEQQPATIRRSRIAPIFRYSIAACVLIGLFLGFYSRYYSNPKTQNNTQAAAKNRVDTISNKAVLVLGNGDQITLNETGANKRLAESNTGATNNANKLSYTQQETSVTTYNTLNVPRGVRYSVELPDGTLVMLNAASSLTYPTRFDGGRRSVTLTGEGYFQVAKDPAHPFVVRIGSSNVRVLGTTFNINAYRPTINTTLEEGMVLVSSTADSIQLAPGEQARYIASGNIAKSNVDVDTYTGWTRDEMIFDENTSLEEAMEILGRAYNYEIDFSDPELKNRKISANLDKSPNLSTILDYIHRITDIRFTIDQTKRRVTIKKEN